MLHITTYEYDGILPLSESSQSVFNSKIEFNYNNDFLVDLLKINGLAITYNYDDDGKIISAGNFVIDRDYQKVGMISGTNLYNISDSYQYNGYGEVAQYAAKASGTTITSFDYERDPVGRITKITDGQGIATEYQYDLSGRVTEVKINGMVTEAFTYNQNGDRINGTYDDQDRLIEDEKYSYEYNQNGATTARVSKENSEREEYQYDLFGNLLKYQKGDKTVLYIVDAKNRRIGKKLNGNFQYGLVYKDQLNPVAQVDAQGNMVSLFVYATKAHVPDFMEKDGKTYRIITDHLGSVRYVVDVNSNEIAQEMSYNTFGEVLSDTNPGFQPFGFAGGIYDLDTGFVRFGARDYNPSTGRWMSKDPIGFSGGDGNLYRYVGSDPVNWIDSLGMSSSDVSKIEKRFKIIVGDMTKRGDRTSPGWWNNINSTLYDISNGMLGSNYLGCGDQSDVVQKDLQNQSYDDTWNFEWEGIFDPLPHQRIRGISTNPSDPMLIIDPHRNEFQTIFKAN